MATIRIAFAQKVKEDGTSAVTLAVGHKQGTAHLATGVLVNKSKAKFKRDTLVLPADYKDGKHLCQVVNGKLLQAKTALVELQNARSVAIDSLSVRELRDMINAAINPMEAKRQQELKEQKSLFEYRFVQYMEAIDKPGTRACYANTLNRLRAYDPCLSKRKFEDINVEYLKGFEKFLCRSSSSANGRSIKFRNIRTIFNDAIADDITNYYPFKKKKFTIKHEDTASRAIDLEKLKTLMHCEKTKAQQRWTDLFFIVFGLVGINFPDLCSLKEIDQEGYVSYTRAKTSKAYRVKVEPEILELINKHRGTEHLLDYFDTSEYNSVSRRMADSLKKLGIVKGISAYFARHSWASVALNDAEVSMDAISFSLGHSSEFGGAKVTQRYARARQKMRDDANRKVLDLLFN